MKNDMMKNNGSNAFMRNPFRNKWRKNYWDDGVGIKHLALSFLPKIIFGVPFKRMPLPVQLNFDLRPAKEPYEI